MRHRPDPTAAPAVRRPSSVRLPSSGGGRVIGRVAVAGVILALTGGGLAACGKVDARMAARQGMENLQQSRSASFTIRLDDPAGELVAASAADGGDAQDAAELKRMTATTLRVVVDPSGEQTLGGDARLRATQLPRDSKGLTAAIKGGGSMEIELSNAGSPLMGLKVVDGVVYVRADEKKLDALSGGGDDAAAEDLEGDLDEETLGELDGMTDSLPGLDAMGKALSSGKWISVDLATVAADPTLAKLFGGADKAAKPSARPSVDPALALRLVTALRTALQGKVQSVNKIEGDSVRVDYTLRARSAADAVLAVLEDPSYAKLLTGQAAPGVMPDVPSLVAKGRKQLDTVPDAPLHASLLVKDEHLTQVRLDLAGPAQLTKDDALAKVKTAALVIDVDDSADGVAAPASGDVVPMTSTVTGWVKQSSSLLELAMGGTLPGGDAIPGAGDLSPITPGPAVSLSPAEIKKLAELMDMSEAEVRQFLGSGMVSRSQITEMLKEA